MEKELSILNAIVFDPTNRIEGEKLDIHIKNGKIVESVGRKARKINVSGKTMMPCFLATPSRIICEASVAGIASGGGSASTRSPRIGVPKIRLTTFAGHATEKWMPSSSSSKRRLSLKPTTAYLVAQYRAW